MDRLLKKNIEDARYLNPDKISPEGFIYKNIYDLLKKKVEEKSDDNFLTFTTKEFLKKSCHIKSL
jgi:hypothetical protein